MEHRFPGYVLAKDGKIRAGSAQAVDLDFMLELLRSKDLDRYEQVKDRYFTGCPAYTTGTAREQLAIVYATWPRSGNSLMRKYFENVTGTVTGSDMVLKHNPNVALQYSGFLAEGVTDSSTFFRKTHYPCQFPF